MTHLRPFQNDDESDCDELLSPELEALAEQLADDARMLAEKYPAPSPSLLITAGAEQSPAASTVVSKSWNLARRVIAASVLVAAGIGVMFVAKPANQRRELAVDARQGQPSDLNLNAAASLLREPAIPQTLPAVSFQEFSGPEQEAVLDLLEENALGQSSLSI